jgi:hypothetical protein
LPGEVALEMARDLVGAGESLAGLAALLGERSAGNPLFLEELARALADLEPAEFEAMLGVLLDAEFLELRRGPEAGASFHHPLTQEVAYRSQLAAPRSARHALAPPARPPVRARRGPRAGARGAGPGRGPGSHPGAGARALTSSSRPSAA